ncbi:MAG: serine hydrolase [Gemmatimonadota bacterium]|nr:serine hydrolase [Gemmatimonadota bacterium]
MKKPHGRHLRPFALAGAALTTVAFGPLPSVAPATAQTRAERADRFMQAFHDQRRFNGVVLVADEGEILYRGAFGFADDEGGPNDVSTRFRIASITKQFTAATIMRLVEAGALRLDAPIRDYIPEYPHPAGDSITIEHLLTHTSGIPSYTNLPSFAGEMLATEMTPGEIVALTWNEPLEFEPGSRFAYNNTGYVLLGWIVERVTGRPYEEALAELVLSPLGLEHTGYDHAKTPAAGHAAGYTRTLVGYEDATFIDPSLPHAAGMLYSTVDDLYRWGRALVGWDPGPFDDPATAERMMTPFLDGYGYGLGIGYRTIGREDSVRVIQHSGGIFGFATMLRVFPDHDRMIVLLDNTSSSLGPILDGLTNLLWGAEARLPKPSIAERLLPIVESGGPEAAMERYRNWRRTRPDDYEYGPGELMTLARHYHDAGDGETAAVILETHAEEFPDMPIAHYALHEIYVEMGDTTRAVSRLETALRSNPGQPNLLEALLNLGVEPPAALRMPPIEVPVEQLGRFAGSYRVDPTTTLDVELVDEGLTAARTDEPSFRLIPQAETTFLLEGSAIQFVFEIVGAEATAVSILESGQRVTFPREPASRPPTGFR